MLHHSHSADESVAVGEETRYWTSYTLSLVVTGPSGTREYVLDKPFAQISSLSSAEVVLESDVISKRGIYLHATDEGIYCIPLDENSRLPHRWLSRHDRISLGPYSIKAELVGSPGMPLPKTRLDEKSNDFEAPSILVYHQGRKLASRKLTQRLTLLGRKQPCPVRIRSDKLSSCHCLLYRELDRIWVVDLLSSNGTQVNGRQVRCALLEPGDHLRLNEIHIRLPNLDRQAGAASDSSAELGGELSSASDSLSTILASDDIDTDEHSGGSGSAPALGTAAAEADTTADMVDEQDTSIEALDRAETPDDVNAASHVARLEARVADLRDQCAADRDIHARDIAERDAQIQSLMSELATQSAQLQTARQEAREIPGLLSQIRAFQQLADDQHQEFARKQALWQARVQSLEEENAELCRQFAQLKNASRETEEAQSKTIAGLTADLARQQQASQPDAEQAATLASLEADQADLRRQLQAAHQERDQASTALADHLQLVENFLAGRREEIEADSSDDIGRQLGELSERLWASRVAQLDALQLEDSSGATERALRLERQVVRLKQELEELRAARRQAESADQVARTEREVELRNERQQAAHAIGQLKESLVQQSERLKQLRTEKDQIESMLAGRARELEQTLQEERRQHEESRAHYSQEQHDLERKLANLQRKLSAAEAEAADPRRLARADGSREPIMITLVDEPRPVRKPDKQSETEDEFQDAAALDRMLKFAHGKQGRLLRWLRRGAIGSLWLAAAATVVGAIYYIVARVLELPLPEISNVL